MPCQTHLNCDLWTTYTFTTPFGSRLQLNDHIARFSDVRQSAYGSVPHKKCCGRVTITTKGFVTARTSGLAGFWFRKKRVFYRLFSLPSCLRGTLFVAANLYAYNPLMRLFRHFSFLWENALFPAFYVRRRALPSLLSPLKWEKCKWARVITCQEQ